ncbi:hypothetical protein [Idiomarina sp. UBA3162]|uniref:hypothetical protein n=1 Tax=Idiomarina sp. UBA3162 TaxID=1946641 RepID=UPI000C95B372|nr:hypothetical protein [Idiomarina sp. UBA3162]MAD52446.1 hypothetical protein [Idiomarinaceae bacterium]
MKYSLSTDYEFSGLSSLTCVIATKRSGHHAFIEWLCSHLHDYFYLNNVNVNPDVERDKYQKKHIETDINIEFLHSEADEFGDVQYSEKDVEHFLMSFENKAVPSVSRSGRLESLKNLSLREHLSNTAILFLRDPINCLASIARYNEVNPNFRVSVEQQAGHWVALAKDFFDSERAKSLLGLNVKTVRYNDFIRDRVKITDLLGNHLKHSEKRMSNLSRFGGGGDSKFKNAKSDMSVDALESRWKMLESPAVITDIFKSNADLRELSRQFYRDSQMSDAMKLGVENFLGAL